MKDCPWLIKCIIQGHPGDVGHDNTPPQGPIAGTKWGGGSTQQPGSEPGWLWYQEERQIGLTPFKRALRSGGLSMTYKDSHHNHVI